jgi:hypothetical protein
MINASVVARTTWKCCGIACQLNLNCSYLNMRKINLRYMHCKVESSLFWDMVRRMPEISFVNLLLTDRDVYLPHRSITAWLIF